MRLFLTSYQKSGTHQIMPALLIRPDIVERSGNDMRNIPARFYSSKKLNYDGISENVDSLRSFEKNLFGHLSFLPQYYDALQTKPTKTLVNVRDPRDVVVSNYHNIQRLHFGKHPGHGHLNLFDNDAGKCLMDTDDPISALIEIEAARWPHWWGWLDQDPAKVMVVKYRELRQNGRETMQKIIEFADPYHIDINHATKRLRPKMERATVRRCIVGEHKELFEPHHIELANDLFGETLEKLGYDK